MKRHLMLAAIGAALVACPLFSPPSLAQNKPAALTVLGHRVHQSVSTGETGGTTGSDVTECWRKAAGVQINWITADISGSARLSTIWPSISGSAAESGAVGCWAL